MGESWVTSVQLEQIDWHLGEAGCLLQVVTHIAELEEDEERARLRPAAITALYVMAATSCAPPIAP